MSTKDDTMIDYKFYIKQYSTTQDQNEKIKAALAIVKLIAEGRLTMRVSDGVWHYTPKSNYKNRCQECGVYYQKDEPAFFRDSPKGALHEKCASAEVKASSPEWRRLHSSQPAPAPAPAPAPTPTEFLFDDNSEDDKL